MEEISEKIKKLGVVLNEKKVEVGLLAIGTVAVVQKMKQEGKFEESQIYFYNHMKKIAKENGVEIPE